MHPATLLPLPRRLLAAAAALLLAACSAPSDDADVRVINAVAGSEALNFVFDDSVRYGSVAAGTGSDFDSTTQSGAHCLTTDATLTAQGVYSLFLLGSLDAPTGVLRKDR